MDANMQFRTCPNCGKTVNANHSTCWNCKMVFYQQPTQQTYYQQPQYIQPNFRTQYNDGRVLNIVGMVIALVGFGLSLIALFLPYVSVNVFGYSQSESVIASTTDSYIIIGLCAIGIIIVACRCKTYGIDTMILSVFILFLTFFHIDNVTTKMDEIEYSGFVKVGSGLYILLISGIIVLIGGIMLCVSHSKLKKG